MAHLDLSIWAFEKLADPKWGVIGLQYRRVSCDYQPDKPAPALAQPFVGIPPPTPDTCPTNQWAQIDSRSTEQIQQSIQAGLVYTDSLQNYWQFSNWNAEAYEIPGNGINGGTAVCGRLFPGGAISFLAPQGALANWVSLEFFIKGDGNTIPNIDVNLAADAGSCTGQSINSLKQSGTQSGYTRYVLYLAEFDRVLDGVVLAFASRFDGCGGFDQSEIRRIAFINNQPSEQTVCLDEVMLLNGDAQITQVPASNQLPAASP
eukprot:TRINITY_DN30494_c0_g1_i11.p2 TRINITY_DN30494_c0_g1~~TRINITY_DN30494_c0_g1_i11.p2  ORF type:complete len:261 (+),score=32.57 TRINITY_DN30494_c0_g1_i11:162-944(+)